MSISRFFMVIYTEATFLNFLVSGRFYSLKNLRAPMNFCLCGIHLSMFTVLEIQTE